jgi:thiamine-phosphate pyrophosphorylase
MHPPPRQWLLTDERMGARLWEAVGRLPRGSGVVLRHHSLAAGERRAMARRLRALAARRGWLLAVAGLSGFGGLHWHRGARRHAAPFVTASAHSAAEVRSAFRAGADLVFLSPVFPTRSHPGAPTLGPVRFGLARTGTRGPVVALGGIDRRSARRLKSDGIAGIDLWLAAGRPPVSGRASAPAAPPSRANRRPIPAP